MSARRAGRAARHGEAVGALPTLSGMSDLPSFDELTPTAGQLEECSALVGSLARMRGIAAGELSLGCVVRLDRGFPAVACADATFRAEHATSLAGPAAGLLPAVGDWVVVRRAPGHDMGVIEQVLARKSDIARWRGGSRGERQTLAANVDVVLVAQALGERPVSVGRIARSVVVARDCGADASVVLTKADRVAHAGRFLDDVSRVRDALGEGVDVVACASGAAARGDELAGAARRAGIGWGDEAVRALVPAGVVGIVLGESGAGKSTLLNSLLGHAALETAGVRERDDAGRHTTVCRRMVSLPGAGVVVDEPGLRSLPLVGHEHGLSLVFPEVCEAAAGCRFRDCTHTSEPGCAVLAEVAAGRVPAERLDAYRALAAEMRDSRQGIDPDVTL